MSQLHIRPYEPADQVAVICLHNVALEATGAHVGNGAWDADLLNIEDVYLKNDGVFLVGVREDIIVAMGALLKMSDHIAQIKRMRVLPEFQRKGIGQAILDALEKEAVERGYGCLCLDTTVRQIAAQQMYLKNGYVEVGRRSRGLPFDTIFYEKVL